MNDRPSDAMTGKVVAEWYENENPPTGTDTDYYNKFWIEDGKVFAATRDSPTTNDFYCFDPRDSTDEALGLLYALCVPSDGQDTPYVFSANRRNACFRLRCSRGSFHLADLPISGQPFRYAVVNLAIKVMGLEEDKEVNNDQVAKETV